MLWLGAYALGVRPAPWTNSAPTSSSICSTAPTPPPTITHPDTGQIVAKGTTSRRPTAAQRRHVETRDRTCTFPGCRSPATDCDLDHRTPHSQGGPTHIENLGPLCRHHHNLHHHHGWTYQPLPGGDYQWTSPLGHTYTTSGTPP